MQVDSMLHLCLDENNLKFINHQIFGYDNQSDIMCCHRKSFLSGAKPRNIIF